MLLLFRLREKILNALQGNEIGSVMDPTKYSRNYKIGSLEGNVIFESEDLLPNEVILDMTLNAFGYDIDMFEVQDFSIFPPFGQCFYLCMSL